MRGHYWFIEHSDAGEEYTLTTLECSQRDARLIALAPELLESLKALLGATEPTYDSRHERAIAEELLETIYGAEVVK